MGDEMVSELEEQFRRQWDTLRDLVGAVPEGQWNAGEMPHLVPGRLVYHILSGAEVYARSCTFEDYLARRRFGLDWQTVPAAELPDRQTTLRGIDELEKDTAAWLESLGNEGLMSSDDGFPWTGSRKIGRAVYLLRHTQNHIGEANAELRRRGLPRGKWR
jgi:hypothetical protein